MTKPVAGPRCPLAGESDSEGFSGRKSFVVVAGGDHDPQVSCARVNIAAKTLNDVVDRTGQNVIGAAFDALSIQHLAIAGKGVIHACLVSSPSSDRCRVVGHTH